MSGGQGKQKPTERKEERDMLYNIRWFDSTKAGKIIVRKYEGMAEQNEGTFTFTYKGNVKNINKADCTAWVMNNGSWQLV